MKRSKRLLLLLGALAVVCAATLAVVYTGERREEIRVSGQVVLEVDPDPVQTLSWDYEGQTLSFHKEDGQWLYDGDEAFPVSQEKISGLLGQFAEFSAAFTIDNAEDLGQYGLDDPVCTIRLSDGVTDWEILLGDYSPMDSQRYVSTGDGSVYLAAEDPLEEFDAPLEELIENDTVPDFGEVAAVAFSGEEEYSFRREEEKPSLCEEDLYFAGELPLDTGKVDSYLRAMTNMDLTDYVSYHATQEELARYGLDDPELTVTVEYSYENEEEETVSDTFILSVARDPEEAAAAAEAEAEAAGEEEAASGEEEEEITAYARVGESPILYRISSDAYTSLMAASADDLRHSELFPGDFDQVTGVEISLDGESHTLASEGEGEDRVWSYGETTLDIAAFREALEALEAYSFTGESPAQALEISLTLTLENEEVPETSIALYRYDGSYCLAVVDGEPTALVQRSAAVDLIEAVNAFVLG